jgi:hypothetical protein
MKSITASIPHEVLKALLKRLIRNDLGKRRLNFSTKNDLMILLLKILVGINPN